MSQVTVKAILYLDDYFGNIFLQEVESGVKAERLVGCGLYCDDGGTLDLHLVRSYLQSRCADATNINAMMSIYK